MSTKTVFVCDCCGDLPITPTNAVSAEKHFCHKPDCQAAADKYEEQQRNFKGLEAGPDKRTQQLYADVEEAAKASEALRNGLRK